MFNTIKDHTKRIGHKLGKMSDTFSKLLNFKCNSPIKKNITMMCRFYGVTITNSQTLMHTQLHISPVGSGNRIHWLHLCKGVRPPPGYDTEQSDGEIPLISELWRMLVTPLLPLLPGPGAVAPGRVQSMGQIELNCAPMLNWIAWRRTVFWHLKGILMQNWII